MNASASVNGNFVEEFDRVAAVLPGAGDLPAQRRSAIERFNALGLPGRRQEAWKYTSVTPLAGRAFRAATREDAGIAAADLAALLPQRYSGHVLMFINGHLREDLSALAALPPGVSIRSLAGVLQEAPLQAARRAPGEASPFTALNDAFFTDGVLITLAADAVVDQPIFLLFLTTAAADSLAVYPRVLIHAGMRAKAAIVETYRGANTAPAFTDAVTEIIAAEGAHIEHYTLQQEAASTFHIGHLYIDQGPASTVVSHSIALGALLARRDIEVRLAAAQASVTLNGLYMPGARQHIDHHTRIDHLSPHTRSEEYYKGVLSGNGRGVFNGKVVVHPHAIKTDARQSNHNLLLSTEAEIDTKPELEIYADDVKCAHGASVGRLDADALFYLRARGLDEAAARGLLTQAFAADVIERISIDSLRRELSQRVLGQLAVSELSGATPGSTPGATS